MHHNKSTFTILLPIMCIVGIIVLVVMWNKPGISFVKKNAEKVQGPGTPPPTFRQ